MIERVFHYNGKEYHLVQSEIHTPLGVTADLFKCSWKGCEAYIGGGSVISHFIEKHTMKDFLEYQNLINKKEDKEPLP